MVIVRLSEKAHDMLKTIKRDERLDSYDAVILTHLNERYQKARSKIVG